MCQRKFEQMAKDANAIYKLDKLVLVNRSEERRVGKECRL